MIVRTSAIAGRGSFTDTIVSAATPVVRFDHCVDRPDDLGRLNHSCDPNLGWDDGRTLVAVRDIGAGEELTLDYATCISDPAWTMYCHCETYRCRQLVEGTDWRIPQLQRRYAGRWSPTVQSLIDAAG